MQAPQEFLDMYPDVAGYRKSVLGKLFSTDAWVYAIDTGAAGPSLQLMVMVINVIVIVCCQVWYRIWTLVWVASSKR